MAAYNYSQQLGSVKWVISHKLNTKFIAIDVFKLTGGSVYEKVLPYSMEINDDNTVTVQFSTPVAGRARIISKFP